MRVRIVKHVPRQLEGINLARFELGGIYEAGGAVLDLLIISGYAIPSEDEIKPDRKDAIKSLADARIATDTPSAEDIISPAGSGDPTSRQAFKGRPRKIRARQDRTSSKRQKR